MNYYRDTISHSTTGIKTTTTGFQPVEAELVVAPAPGSALANIHFSLGRTDGTNQGCDSSATDTGHIFQRRYNDRMVSISEWNGTAYVEVFKITFDSFTATTFTYNVVTADVNYQVERIVRG